MLEAANYPVTPDGDKVLGDRGITVVPDVLANAGGVTGSYFEWSQNIQQFTWKEERFNAELRDRMRLAYAATADTAAELGVHAPPGRVRHRHPAGGPRLPPARVRVIPAPRRLAEGQFRR